MAVFPDVEKAEQVADMDRPHNDKQPPAAEPSQVMSTVADDAEVSDPDEDDLDDLDDVDGQYDAKLINGLDLLDEFSSSKISTGALPAQIPRQASPPANDPTPAAAGEFSQQLQAQMAALMGNGEETPEMRKEIQAILQELGAAIETDSASVPSVSDTGQTTPPTATDESFQEAILRTMQRMQDSGDKAHAAAVAGEDSEDFLAQMLKAMQNGDPDATAGEPEFSKMLMTMMEQLTNKDILYDPMKELNNKFPEWMSTNKVTVEADDQLRYEKQQRLITEIVNKFEESTYSDANVEDREYIVERMQEVMQAAGSPPADLVGDMSGAQTALQDMGSSCPQQ
ncbi:MAG: hypothetical protein Q9209_006652 [Squamulea sp. 1 TL-2023]